MAIMTTIYCSICKQHVQECRVNNDYSSECSSCKRHARDRKEREWRTAREGLTLEERLRDLEAFMYHHGTHYNGPERY